MSRDRQALRALRDAAVLPHRGTVTVAGQTVATADCVDIPLQVRGAMPGDQVRLEPPADLGAGLIKSHETVTGTGTVVLRLCNVTSGPATLVAADWRYTVTRPR